MPQIAYCTDDEGYYTHSEHCTTDQIESARQGHDVYVLPANGYIDAPSISDGCVAKRVNGAWVNVENHIGEQGYINGVPAEVKEYGPLPDGWSTTHSAPTAEQLFSVLRASRDARLAATDKYMLPDYPIAEDALAQVKAYRAELRAMPDQPGAPWDGGGDATPWPEQPSFMTIEE